MNHLYCPRCDFILTNATSELLTSLRSATSMLTWSVHRLFLNLTQTWLVAQSRPRERKGSSFLRNVGDHSQNDADSHPRRPNDRCASLTPRQCFVCRGALPCQQHRSCSHAVRDNINWVRAIKVSRSATQHSFNIQQLRQTCNAQRLYRES